MLKMSNIKNKVVWYDTNFNCFKLKMQSSFRILVFASNDLSLLTNIK